MVNASVVQITVLYIKQQTTTVALFAYEYVHTCTCNSYTAGTIVLPDMYV